MWTWAQVLLWAFKLLFRVTSALQTQGLLDAGAAQAIAKVLRAQADDLHKIQDTMASAGKRFDDAGGMPSGGKFRD